MSTFYFALHDGEKPMHEWQRRRRHEQQKLRAMDKAFGGSLARLRAMYLEEEDHATEEEKHAGTPGTSDVGTGNVSRTGEPFHARPCPLGKGEAGNISRTGERSATPRR